MSGFRLCPFSSSRFPKSSDHLCAPLDELLFSNNSFWSIYFSKYLKFWKNMGRILDHQEQGHQALNSNCNKVNLRRYNFTSFMMIKCQWFSAVYGLTGLKLPSLANNFIENFQNMLVFFIFLWSFLRVGFMVEVTHGPWHIGLCIGRKIKNSCIGVQVILVAIAPLVSTVTVSYL